MKIDDWGPATWYLMHTLAEKVKEDEFTKIKNDFIDIILNICSSLPCPECAEHARNIMKNLNKNKIVTKENLKIMLFTFHNNVNKRLRKPLYTNELLDAKYKSANTQKIVINFINTWKIPNPNPKLITHNFHKNKTLNKFIEWWRINNTFFEK